jgi:hypothetical protein
MCVVAFLLARLLHLRAQRAGYGHSQETLLDTLAQIRKTTVVRSTSAKGLRTTSQLEYVPSDLQKLTESLGVNIL